MTGWSEYNVINNFRACPTDQTNHSESHSQVASCLTIVPFVFQGDLSGDLRLTRKAVSFHTGPTEKRPGQGHLR